MAGTDQVSTEHGTYERAGEEDAGSFREFFSDLLVMFPFKQSVVSSTIPSFVYQPPSTV